MCRGHVGEEVHCGMRGGTRREGDGVRQLWFHVAKRAGEELPVL